MAYKSKFFQSGAHLDPSKYEHPKSPWAVEQKTTPTQQQIDTAIQQTFADVQSGRTLLQQATTPSIYDNTARKIDRAKNRANSVRNELSSRLAEETASGQPILDPLRDKLAKLEQQQAELEAKREQEKAQAWEQKQKASIDAVGNAQLLDELRQLNDLEALVKSNKGMVQMTGGTPWSTQTEQDYWALQKRLSDQYGESLGAWKDYARRMENREQAEKTKSELSDAAKENPFWWSLGTLPLNMGSGIGFLDAAGQRIKQKVTGSDTPIDYNTPAMLPSQATNAIRGSVSEKIEADTAGKLGSDTPLGNLYSGAYNLGMSMGDSVMGIAAGGNPIFQAGAAATNAMNDAISRGATTDQALMFGLTSAAMEGVMEKLSLDSLFNMTDTKTVKQLALNALKQGGVEATEEAATNIANTVADAVIMGNKSQLQTSVRDYISSGYSPEQAEKKALSDWGKGLLTDAIGGFISGEAFGTAGSVVNYAGNRNSGPVTQTQVDSAIQETLGQNKTASVIETEAEVPLLLPEQSEITKQRGYPYERKDAVYKVVEIPQEKVAEIEAYINTVDNATARKKYKRILKNLFSGQLFTNANTVANEIAYEIGIGSKGIGEIIARQPVNAQTLAMLEQLNEVVENAKYIASEPTSHDNRRGVIRTDLFETDTMVGDKPGTAKMRVNVTKDGNKLYYATNKIKEAQSPQPWADDSRRHGIEETASSNNSIPGSTENVNGAENGSAKIEGLASESEMPQSVGSAASGLDHYTHAANTYGTIEPGENPARVVDVPKSMDGETNVMQTVRTIMEADVTPDAAIPVLENEIVKGSFSAMPITDQAAAGRAEATVKRVGYDQALADWRAEVRAGRVSKDSVAVGETLYNAAVSAGDTKSAVKIAIDLATQVRSAAQALQAVRMLKKMSPAAQLYGVKQSVDNLQKQLQGQYGDRSPDLVIDETLAANFLNAKTDAERTATEEALYKDIARQIPANFSDKWNAWRYLSMLGNPRTHIRNIIGNAAFAPVRGVKNQVGGLMEAIAQRAGIIDESQRTKSVGFNWSKKRRALVKAAKADYANAEGQIQSGDKYNSATDIIEKNRRIFDIAALETLRRGNSAALDVEDKWFSKGAYASSLAGYLNARGYTAEDFTGKGMTEQQKNDARAYAILEAQKATYRDLNALSELVTSMKFKNPANSRTRSGELAKRAANTVVEGVLPFKKTPANILARAVEYSPAGLAKALTVDSVQVAQGKISAAEYMDHLASGLTGSGLFALGYFLAQSDLLVGGSPEDEDQFNLENRQPYALEVGGTSVTLDWLAPEALPVFMGVELCKAIEDVNGQAFSVETMKSFFRGVTGPLLEMSMLSGLQDALDAVSYADDKMTAVVANAALGYLGQAVPTLFGQIERIIGNNAEIRQTTFTQEGQFLDKDTQYALGNALNKVPFRDFQQIPYIDAWGRTESTGGVAARAANNLLNPAYVSEVTETFVDAEIKRLEEQTGKNLTPARAEKVLTVDGEKILLTADEYVTYATAKGQNDYTFREHLIGRENYAALDDKTKAKAMEYAKEYADALAREETGLKADMPEWMAELEGAGIEAVTQRFVEKAVESMAGDKKLYDNKYDGISGLLNDGTIDDVIALSLFPKETQEKYDEYGTGLDIAVLAEVIGYKNSEAAKSEYETKFKDGKRQEVVIEGKSNQDKTRKYIESLGVSKSDMRKIWCCIYAESTCPW